ncbi:peptide methionine sulfoxide reductase MsrA [Enterococcus florum]|uniref:Peptide methionine sulfoxide reductase MsrA n=1 Tax=Enterococcus florum TaxID=2480627 RepID=A0A4P5PQY0_9ENTE|nr:peptide-methionine (S)-S-oxide reductase MsrA [Enterococcus florum]GCF95303.1 peptide methionine sulfoxide reductase MsrA [Enterococcus florum]
MKFEQTDLLRDMYNLILNPHTRDWERSRLVVAKDALEKGANVVRRIDALEAELRPLATRNTLTPDVADFYAKITHAPSANEVYDLSKHTVEAAYQERAIFAGGCFWCMIEPFETKAGIVSVLSGYTGGTVEQPSYEQVSGGYTGHVEAVEIIFDTRIIRYQELVERYWHLIDPTDAFGQFQDRGAQYKPIIFVQNEEQRRIAEKSKQAIIDSQHYKKPIVTEIRPASIFWPAENYHQQFYKKHPHRYKRIKQARQQLLVYQKLTGKLRKKS